MWRTDHTPILPLCVAWSLSLFSACNGTLTYQADDSSQASDSAADGAGGDSGPSDAASDGSGGDSPADPDATRDAPGDEGDPAAVDQDGAADGAVDAGDDQPNADADDPDEVGSEDAVIASCDTYDAQIVSHTIPATMPAAGSRWVSLTVANNGAGTWTEAEQFRLGSPNNSDPFVEDPRFTLPDGVSVASGADYRWVFELRAPLDGGEYTTDWQMLQENQCWFGEVLALPITVEGSIEPGVCGPPLPPWEDERSKIKLNCGGFWCDATPSCHGCEYCETIGLGCLPGTGPAPPCTPRCDCPVRPDGHPERSACEAYFLGGRPLWRSDGEVIVNPDNDFLSRCEGCSWIEVCRADGTLCTTETF